MGAHPGVNSVGTVKVPCCFVFGRARAAATADLPAPEQPAIWIALIDATPY